MLYDFRFNMVSYSPQSRRLAVGAKNGQIALYDLRSSRCQVSNENLKRSKNTGASTYCKNI